MVALPKERTDGNIQALIASCLEVLARLYTVSYALSFPQSVRRVRSELQVSTSSAFPVKVSGML